MNDRRHGGGFTLVEMLVALLVAGMALALATQALGQYQRAHTRVVASERTSREHTLSAAWFRASMQGLYPSPDLGPPGGRPAGQVGVAEQRPPFSGSSDAVSGITLAPVLGGQGVPVFQHWKIVQTDGRPALTVEESGRVVALALPRARSMRFHFSGKDGTWHGEWPPEMGQSSELPTAVLLEIDREDPIGGPLLIAAAVLGPRDPLGPIESAYEYAPP